MILTAAKLNKTVQAFSQTVAKRVTYELDGVETQTTFTVSQNGQTVRIIVQLDSGVSGKIGNIKVYDADGDLACSTDKYFIKPAHKKMYVAFSFKFAERVI